MFVYIDSCGATGMPENDKQTRPLFELAPAECEDRLEEVFRQAMVGSPIASAVTAALMVAEATSQRIALMALDRIDHKGQCEWPEYLAIPQDSFTFVEDFTSYLLSGKPARIGLVTWDSAGYLHGWYLTEEGYPDVLRGPCPETVRKLSEVLRQFVACDEEWRPLLERHAEGLDALWSKGREKAEAVARKRVASQGLLAKVLKRTSLERELLSLGFG